MKSHKAKIHIYFPKKTNIASKQSLVNHIVRDMKKDGGVNYAGFLTTKQLKQGLLHFIGDGSVDQYRQLPALRQIVIKKDIVNTIAICSNTLPLPDKVFVFVFPWLPTKSDSVIFGGVMGFAPYSLVFHLFLSPQSFTRTSLIETVAHELNHALFLYYHHDRCNVYTLLDDMVMEGLAEHFREATVDGKPAPWSCALTRQEAFRVLKSLKERLYSKDHNLLQKIRFGGGAYKRWTGYSIGYWLVKEYMKKGKKKSWEELMKIEPKSILQSLAMLLKK